MTAKLPKLRTEGLRSREDLDTYLELTSLPEDQVMPSDKPPPSLPQVRLMPAVQDLLDDADVVAAAALADLRRVLQEGSKLTAGEIKTFEVLGRYVLQRSREEREREKADSIEGLDDEALKKLAKGQKEAKDNVDQQAEGSPGADSGT